MINDNIKPEAEVAEKKVSKKSKTKKFNREKTASTSASEQPKRTHSSKPNPWGNIFDSSFADDIKDGMNHFMNGDNNFCAINQKDNHANNIMQDMMHKLSHNLRHNFEQNIELGQEILKCKTASDFIEFQRKNFEVNYKNTVKIYSDLFHDMQSLTTQSLKGVKPK